MFRQELPRIYELRDRIEDPATPSAYFRDFDATLRDSASKMDVWLARERDLAGLDPSAWKFLIEEALPYLTKRDENGRGWHQLIAILNQARAYNFLTGEGCSAIRFVPRAKSARQETPDLQATLGGQAVLCEVKTIAVSDSEVESQQPGKGGYVSALLGEGFFRKITSSLTKAKQQMESFEPTPGARLIVSDQTTATLAGCSAAWQEPIRSS